ncbi:PP2C family protein-serine/threonine phosphatase [Streptomyces cyaneofuscatus]|uniref:PP2C family protein-serine/threonine phosphatase n=1 Tax=Streptomyces cyaneofuscatus TaxID=66883 RepID=UPI003651AB09
MKTPAVPAPRHTDGACVGALLAIAVADVLLGPSVTLLALFAAAPAVAASRTTARAVVGTGLFAALIAVTVSLHERLLGSPEGFLPLLALGIVTLFSAAAARTRARQQHRLTQLSDVAGAAQQTILGPLPATSGPARIAASYESAADGAQVGGDFYDVTPVRDGVRLVVGDVQGKGLDAVKTAATALAAFRESAPVSSRLETVGLKMSCALARRGTEDRFVTAVLAELSDDGTLTLVNYGHTAPLVPPAPGGMAEAAPDHPGMPLGLDALGDGRPGRYLRTLAPGDRMLFHTDGLDEARDATGRFYPLAARTDLLRVGTLATGLEALRTDVHRHTAPASPADDSALLLLEYTGTHNASPQRRPGPLLGVTRSACEKCAVTDCAIPPRLRPHHNPPE